MQLMVPPQFTAPSQVTASRSTSIPLRNNGRARRRLLTENRFGDETREMYTAIPAPQPCTKRLLSEDADGMLFFSVNVILEPLSRLRAHYRPSVLRLSTVFPAKTPKERKKNNRSADDSCAVRLCKETVFFFGIIWYNDIWFFHMLQNI